MELHVNTHKPTGDGNGQTFIYVSVMQNANVSTYIFGIMQSNGDDAPHVKEETTNHSIINFKYIPSTFNVFAVCYDDEYRGTALM